MLQGLLLTQQQCRVCSHQLATCSTCQPPGGAPVAPHTSLPPPHRRARQRCAAAIREQGVEFQEVQEYWSGDKFRCLGAGTRVKKLGGFIPVKVYVCGLYVEAAKALNELGIRARGGFFSGADDYAQGLIDLTCGKLLHVQLLRNVDGTTFFQDIYVEADFEQAQAFEEALAPKLRMTGQTGALQQFGDYLGGKNLEKASDVLLLWTSAGVLEVLLSAAEQQASFAQATPGLIVDSPALCRALFETFLGDSSVVPDAKAAWARETQRLLESEAAASTDKAGAG